jgi:predicted DNA-binding transcriptional regulator YafY
MYYPTTRVLTVLEMLQARESITGPELAERLDVDVRSIRRYITMLRDMGIPVETERGRYGSYALQPGARLPPLMFTETEIMAIVLGLMAARSLGMAGALGIENAQTKIARVLPVELRQRVWALQGALTLNLDARADQPDPATIAALSLAVYDRRQVWIRYGSMQGEQTARAIDPYGLVYHGGLWYAPAFCHLRGDMRLFRLDRVLESDLTGEVFERPEAFDALQFVLQSIAALPWGHVVRVRLQADLEQARAVIPVDMGTLETIDGEVLLTSHIESLSFMARWLVRLGIPFRVLEPDALRDELRRLAARIIEMAEA